METVKNSSKKCKSCNEWSVWNGTLEAHCNHCSALLDAETLKRDKVRDAYTKPAKPEFKIEFIKINDTDSIPIMGIKYIALLGQVIFAATISFIIWVSVVVAG